MNLRHMQQTQPWAIAYSDDFEAARKNHMPHLYASHTILHGMKSMGKLAAIVEELDHTGKKHLSAEQKQKAKDMAADLVTTALRLANIFSFDLETELLRRAAEKNGAPYPPEPTNG